MAIALDAHTASGAGAFATPISSPQTFSHTCGSGSDRLLVVEIFVRGGGGGTITGVTYNSVAMTQVGSGSVSGSVSAYIFYLVNPASGSNTVSISHSLTGTTHFHSSATSLTGVNQSSPLNTSNTGGASNTGPMTVSLTTSVANCWVIDCCTMRTGSSEGATMTAVTNRTMRTDVAVTAGCRALASTIGPAASAGSHTCEWTKTFNHDWAIIAAAFAPAGAGTNGQIKVWNGSTFVAKPVKVWNGSSWVTKPVKYWNGSSWITTPY